MKAILTRCIDYLTHFKRPKSISTAIIIFLLSIIIALYPKLIDKVILAQALAFIATILAFIRWMPQSIKLYKTSDFRGININLFILFSTASLLVIINQLSIANRNYLLITQVGTQYFLSTSIILKYFWQFKEKRVVVILKQLFFLLFPIYMHQYFYKAPYITLSSFAGIFFIFCWWCQIWTVLVRPQLYKMFKYFKPSIQVPTYNLRGISIPSFFISCLCMLFMIPILLVKNANIILFISYVNGVTCSLIITIKAWNFVHQEKKQEDLLGLSKV